jgi:predicted acyltransferase
MKATAHHLQSLDAFRGITIASMIVVNNPGDWSNVFPQLLHSAWDGVTFADLVFPAFVFILGFVLPFAFARRLEGGRPIPSLYARLCRRAASLFVLGIVLNATAMLSDLGSIRIPGVLQRLALVYLLTSLIVLHTKTAGASSRSSRCCSRTGSCWCSSGRPSRRAQPGRCDRRGGVRPSPLDAD